MINATVEVDGHQYSVSKLNAFTQFHVVRRLGPLLKGITNARQLKELLAPGPDGRKLEPMELMGRLMPLLHPVLEALAELPETDCNYVIINSLGAVQREQMGRWVKVAAPTSGKLMFEDITMPAMLELVGHVLKENLASFFTGTSPSLPVVTA